MQEAGTRSASAFQAQIAAATVVPWLVVLTFGRVGWVTAAMVAVFGAHVPTTAAIYLDEETRPLLRDNPGRYVVAPVGALAALVIVALAAPEPVFRAHLVGMSLWTVHHFTRQTFGIVSLLCAARSAARVSTLERRLIAVTGYAAMLVLVSRAVDGALRSAGEAVAALLMAGCVVVLLSERRTGRMDERRLLTFAGVVAFYLPLFVISDPVVAAATYGAAHGAQYLVMVQNLSLGREAERSRQFLMVAGAAFVLGGVALWGFNLGASADHRLAAAAVNGMLAWHFIADAGLWRMSEPFQRAYVSRRFDFLGGGPRSLKPAPS